MALRLLVLVALIQARRHGRAHAHAAVHPRKVAHNSTTRSHGNDPRHKHGVPPIARDSRIIRSPSPLPADAGANSRARGEGSSPPGNFNQTSHVHPRVVAELRAPSWCAARVGAALEVAARPLLTEQPGVRHARADVARC